MFDDEAAGESLAAAAALRPNVNFCPPAGAPPSGMEDAGSTDLSANVMNAEDKFVKESKRNENEIYVLK